MDENKKGNAKSLLKYFGKLKHVDWKAREKRMARFREDINMRFIDTFREMEKSRLDYALKLLIEGKTTISKAAEIAGMDLLTFTYKVRDSKIMWVKDEVVDRDLKEFS